MTSAVGITLGFFQFVTFIVSIIWIGLFVLLGVLIIQYQDVVFNTADEVDQILKKTNVLLDNSIEITEELKNIDDEIKEILQLLEDIANGTPTPPN